MTRTNLSLILVCLIVLLSACTPASRQPVTDTPAEPVAITPASSAETAESAATYYTAESLPDYEHKARQVIVTENEVTFVDGTGVEKTITKHPERVVGLYPSHIVLWHEAGGRMVGRITTPNSESRMPPTAMEAEIIGDSMSPDKLSYEKIMTLQPDLIVLGIGSQSSMVEKFTELGVETIVFDNENLDDYLKWVKVISNLNGKPEIYDEIIQTVLKPVQAILLKVPAKAHPKALMMQVNQEGKLVAYLPGTTAGGIMDDLGAVNIALDQAGGDNKQASGIEKTDLSYEFLLTQEPDLILLKHSVLPEGVRARQLVAEILADNSIWQSLQAVQTDMIYDLPSDYFHYKPTTEFPQAYEYLAKILYPDIFGAQNKDSD